MAKRLDQKTAVVTAAGQGIGHAIAVAFAREGARIFASDIAPEKLDRLNRLGAHTEPLDVTDAAAIDRYFHAVGQLACWSPAPAGCITAPFSMRTTRSGTAPSR